VICNFKIQNKRENRREQITGPDVYTIIKCDNKTLPQSTVLSQLDLNNQNRLQVKNAIFYFFRIHFSSVYFRKSYHALLVQQLQSEFCHTQFF
jgi:hypothetical protein